MYEPEEKTQHEHSTMDMDMNMDIIKLHSLRT